MDSVVKIAFDLNAAGQGNFFTLDDPVKGVLGGTADDYPLAGDILTDVTADVRAIRVRRGRSNLLEKFQAGALDVVLNNRERLYDPTAGTAVSPYAPSIKPRKEVVVEFNGQRAFSGQVEDWDLAYSVGGDSTATVKASDGFALLAQQAIAPHTATAQATGARVSAILDRSEIAWPAGRRNIDAGLATLQADAIGGTANPAPVNALAYLQQVEQAEPGALFVSKDGLLTFRQRTDLQQVTAVSFTDDGTGIPFTSIAVEYGTEQLRNSVSIARLNAGTATAENTTSQLNYGITAFEITNSLLADDTQAQDLADWLVNLYGEPQLRIKSVGLVLSALPVDQANAVLGLELGDAVQVVFTPNGIGSPISRYVSIDAIEHDVTASAHLVTLDFSATIGGFVLDSSVFGVLDSNVLGF
jgi:hypothetical protein